ncbi:hypothetical protein TNCT_131351 [Trichonephila clavata]|uniref:Fibronectin type-III domain-containing protein n=1 Tax=Trichonephila clavata TaxID=2740835 RepID=A0A8X6JKX9_TRICU|nr:hypothetical protein TNCT_131351 [Trichonephila clavata]
MVLKDEPKDYDREKKWHEERSKKVVVSNVDTSATIAGLKPVTTYHIHVTARNAIGQSLPSSDLTVTTKAEGKLLL